MSNTATVTLDESTLGRLTGHKIAINAVTIRSKFKASYGTYYNIAWYYSTDKSIYQVALLVTDKDISAILTRKSDNAQLDLDIKDINKVFDWIKSSASKNKVSISDL